MGEANRRSQSYVCTGRVVIGAGIENPENVIPLRPFLSSREILIVLIDNAESVFDPQGTGARDVYSAVDELSRCKNISVLITSRVTTIPLHGRRLGIPTLSMNAACGFNVLSIKLLAATTSHNTWDYNDW